MPPPVKRRCILIMPRSIGFVRYDRDFLNRETTLSTQMMNARPNGHVGALNG